ncbi:hypothetical protein HMPREF0765_4814 [Sphingobacterium spiritivorum ATCC 33300]|uniref:Outer membrane protein beta-barrel domain-containing protein n=1 Tax=Sphingobacterium spiritivorum ATCC 33300 TaxID=525372 RepID=C2G5F8_SPHSI|nr:hypothetical protein [Sphingobacterium spiritivorum]EEI89667.1 hypothetical protein HMPREF0765_4814 [Sphingobacterium spiritivorum ATCC 33300]QQS94590.1 PorT [Sphingobacterium spiritivorum]
MIKKLSFIIGLVTLPFLVSAQSISLPFSSRYDEDATLLFGIQYSYVNSRYVMGLKKDWSGYPLDYPEGNINEIKDLRSIKSGVGHGMGVGIPIHLRITDNLYSTLSPTFVFINNSSIIYTGTNDDGTTQKSLTRRTRHTTRSEGGTNFNSFEFPLSLKFRSDEKILKNKFNRYRGYMIAGVKWTKWSQLSNDYDALMASNQQSPDPIIIKPDYLSWEAGIGADIFFTHFKVSPEIKFAQSFGNVLDQNHPLAVNNKFMRPLDKTLIRNVYFSLIFQ